MKVSDIALCWSLRAAEQSLAPFFSATQRIVLDPCSCELAVATLSELILVVNHIIVGGSKVYCLLFFKF